MLASVQTRRTAVESVWAPWQPTTLHGVLDQVAERYPDRPYVVTDERTWTYREVADWSVSLAQGIVAAGVRPGEHVALVMANYADFVPLKYAISRVGAVCIPVNFLNRRDELGYVLAQSHAVMLITMDRFRNLDYLAMLDELSPGWESAGGGPRLPDLREVRVLTTGEEPLREGVTPVADLRANGQDVALPADLASPENTSDIIYTSGTTGSPKGVLLTHDMLTRTAYGAAFSRAFEDDRRVLFSLPMYHVYGYVEGMIAVPYVGGSIVPQVTFDPRGTLAGIAEHRATDVLLVPTMTLGLLDVLEAGETFDLTSLDSMISSGGYAPTSLWDRIDAAFGPLELTTGYGMSETTATTTLTEPGGPPHLLRTTNGRMRPAGCAGDPSLGGALTEYRVVDHETGEVQTAGGVGELLARGPGITSGYFEKPDETAAAFDDEGWFKSGDLGRFDADGFLALIGRSKDLYRCGGEQVVPLEIENVLMTHPAISQAFVVPLRHDRMGEVGVAWIILRDGHSVTAEEVQTFAGEHLARFKVPAHVLPIRSEDVPVTPSGRPRKFLLAELAAERLASASGA